MVWVDHSTYLPLPAPVITAVLPLTALAPTVLIDIVVGSDLLENFTNDDRSSNGGRVGKGLMLCSAAFFTQPRISDDSIEGSSALYIYLALTGPAFHNPSLKFEIP